MGMASPYGLRTLSIERAGSVFRVGAICVGGLPVIGGTGKPDPSSVGHGEKKKRNKKNKK
jgi:hypothetical protein